ncbi:MAG: DUF5702 domain-containing protein [Clostridiales Family XIII bacterium]|jgi:hypothetical protein|nr:DUF5702 domain-containing protein [Clostridiales Family XIII bacterium]
MMMEKPRQGSAAILFTIAFAGMLVLVTCLLAATRIVSGVSYTDAAIRLAGRSILSEYDTELLGRYGVFAFHGDERRIERDIAFYANASLRKDKAAYLPIAPSGAMARIFDIEMENPEANLKEFSLLDIDNFEEQLKSAAISKTAKKLTGRGNGIKNYSDPISGHKNRTLRDEGVTASLPSAGVAWSLPDVSSLSPQKLADISNSAASDVLNSQYIMAAFGCANDGVSEEDSFFDAEIEYILAGNMNDMSNYNSIKARLTLIRFIANNVSFYRDPVKMAQVEALAAPFAAAAGIGEEIACITISEIWIGAETKNDIGLFEAGRKVTFLKSPAHWALTDGKKAVDGLFDGKVINPVNRSGQSYVDYLRVLLFLMDRETKLLRVMDLIQIDMKANYNKDFLIREYYIGFRFNVKALGETFEYTERY